MDKADKKLWKVSRLWICRCGWRHITQGPFSCWVCQETLSFAKWQTGKEALPTPTKMPVNRQPWTVDPRDRIKDQVEVVVIDGLHQMGRRNHGDREMGFADEAGLGKRGRDWLQGQ